jgi:hypothetical protein
MALSFLISSRRIMVIRSEIPASRTADPGTGRVKERGDIRDAFFKERRLAQRDGRPPRPLPVHSSVDCDYCRRVLASPLDELGFPATSEQTLLYSLNEKWPVSAAGTL